MSVLASITFQAVPIIKIGEYSSFKIVDLLLIFLFFILLLKGVRRQTCMSIMLILTVVTIHSLFLSITGDAVLWSSTLIFAGRTVLITAAFCEYALYFRRTEFDKYFFSIYIRFVYLSIIYGFYESYLLFNGLVSPIVPEFINGAGEPILRLRGTFSEPSLFILFLTPALLGQISRKAYWSAAVIGAAIVLTVSSFAVIVAAMLLIVFLTYRNALFICFCIFLAISLSSYVFGSDVLAYSFIEKLWNFITLSASTDVISDSAGIRKITSSIGMEIAAENFPLGIGYGQSVSMLNAKLPQYLISTGIVGSDIPIQSSFPQLMAESGLFGLISVIPLLYTVRHLFKGLTSRQIIAIALYIVYMLIMVYPIENPMIWFFSIYFAIALKIGTSSKGETKT